jgi:hypothetical protein
MGNCIVQKEPASPSVIISAAIWRRSLHNELEFHLETIPSIPHTINSPCTIYQTPAGLTTRKNKDDNHETLFSIGYINGRYWLYRSYKEVIPEPMWIVLPNTMPEKCLQSFKLQTNDVFKMGQYKFVVKEFVKEKSKVDNRNSCTELMLGDEELVHELVLPSKDKELQCRICLESFSTEDNQLIESPCKCTGTVKLLHENCLREWLKSQVTVKDTETVRSYHWKKFRCDVCKQLYPEQIRFSSGKYLNIIEVVHPNSNYMIIENLPVKQIEDKCMSA